MGDGSLGSLLLLVMLVALFWFVTVRPARKRQASQAAMVASLEVGSKIITTSGLHGTIVSMDDTTINLEIAPGVIVTWAKAAVMTRL